MDTEDRLEQLQYDFWFKLRLDLDWILVCKPSFVNLSHNIGLCATSGKRITSNLVMIQEQNSLLQLKDDSGNICNLTISEKYTLYYLLI